MMRESNHVIAFRKIQYETEADFQVLHNDAKKYILIKIEY